MGRLPALKGAGRSACGSRPETVVKARAS